MAAPEWDVAAGVSTRALGNPLVEPLPCCPSTSHWRLVGFCRVDRRCTVETTEASALQQKARAALHDRDRQRDFSLGQQVAAVIGRQHIIPRMWSLDKGTRLTRPLTVPAGHGNVRLASCAQRRSFDARGRADGSMRSGAREGHVLGRLRGREVRMSLSPACTLPRQIAVF